MKSPIDKIRYKAAMLSLLFSCVSAVGFAQLSTSNPGEYAAVTAGNTTINSQVSSQIDAQSRTTVEQNAIGVEFLQIKKWEKKYNSYLKKASGYASTLKAATHAYSDGVRIFMTLSKIYKTIQDNPEGVVATISMNNLYMETLTEMISVYDLLKNSVAKGGEENMLTGSERSKTLWALEDKLSDFQKKLNRLYLSLRHYRLVHVWNKATAGMIDRDVSQVCSQSLKDWKNNANIKIE